MVPLLLAAALATPGPIPEGMEVVVSVDSTATDTVMFTLPACDGVRARFDDTRPPDAARSTKVVVTLRNDGPEMCMYKGLVLLGALEGTYVCSTHTPDGAGFFVPPRGEVSFRIRPVDADASRARITLEIPPGRGMVVLRGEPLPGQVPVPASAPAGSGPVEP